MEKTQAAGLVTTPELKSLPRIFGPHVLIEPKPIETTRGKLIIVHENEDRKQGAVTEGKVVVIGPLAFLDELNPSGKHWYGVGERVIYKKYAGTNIYLDRKLYILLSYEDVIAAIDDKDMVVSTISEE